MPYSRTWDIRVPIRVGDDEAVLLWLMRESAEQTAESFLLKVVEFRDLGDVPPADIDPRGIKTLGEAYAKCRFRAYRVVAEREIVDAESL